MEPTVNVDLTKDQLNKLMGCLTLYEAHVAMTPEKKVEHDALWSLLDDVAAEAFGDDY